ncbi:hypothetical protein BH18ACI5_BH18ACI5_15370 [soil metagenome]
MAAAAALLLLKEPRHRRLLLRHQRRPPASSRPAAISSAWTSPTRASPTPCSIITTGLPNEPQARPYDDTGWTFPEAFNVQAVRVTDAKVLDLPTELVNGDVIAPRGVTGQGSMFAINHNADNALITLRYKLKDADVQISEEPFESAGVKFSRGSFIITKAAQADVDKITTELGLKAIAIPAAPSVKTHPARAARAAILHQWNATQTEGWWRQAFDRTAFPTTTSTRRRSGTPLTCGQSMTSSSSAPAAGRERLMGRRSGALRFRTGIPPRRRTSDLGATDDTRIGMGLVGLMHLKSFIDAGGVFIGSNSTADFAIANNFSYGVTANRPAATTRVVGSLLRTKLVDTTSPVVYGVQDNLAMYSDSGGSFSVSAHVGGGGRGAGGDAPAGGGRGGGPGARATGRGTPDDPDVVQGHLANEGTNLSPLPPPQTVQPWQYALPTDEQLKRNPAALIPPQFRPRVAVRFDAQNTLLVSGLLDGGADIAQRPVVVDVPVGKGHVALFANNPIYRGETIGSYFMVFNTILNFDNLDAGRKLDEK